VNRSIEEYLNGLTPDLATLTQHLLASQKDKHYLLWDTQTFHTDRLSDEDLTLSEFVAEHRNKKNTLVVASDTMTYRCLLRWRNHKGILKPAWQISVKRNVT
jgi:hypothetical protein